MAHRTQFGSLEHFEKGGVEVINDDARNYVFSNVYEVASKAEPYEKIAVGKNLKYVLEAVRAEGTSPCRKCRIGGRRSSRPPAIIKRMASMQESKLHSDLPSDNI